MSIVGALLNDIPGTEKNYINIGFPIAMNEQQVVTIFFNSNNGNNLSIFCSEEYELSPTEKTMSVEKFAKK